MKVVIVILEKNRLPRLLTSAELQKKLGISRATLWRYEQDGLPSIKVLNSKRYNEEHVRNWIKNREQFQIPKGYLRSEDVQDMLSISRTTLHRLIKKGLPHEKQGKRLLFKEETVNKWLFEQQTNKK